MIEALFWFVIWGTLFVLSPWALVLGGTWIADAMKARRGL
jgi:hypothetical protein